MSAAPAGAAAISAPSAMPPSKSFFMVSPLSLAVRRRLVVRVHRAVSEPVVDAKFHRVNAFLNIHLRSRAEIHVSEGCALGAEIDVVVLDFRGPWAPEAEFHAATCRPSAAIVLRDGDHLSTRHKERTERTDCVKAVG